MKPGARIGIILVLLGGCSTAGYQPDMPSGFFNASGRPMAETRPAARPMDPLAAQPAYVGLSSANGGNGPAIAQAHLTLPTGTGGQPLTAATSSALVAPTADPRLNYYVKQDPPPPAWPTEPADPGSATVRSAAPVDAAASAPGQRKASAEDKEPTLSVEDRPALSDVLAQAARMPAPKPAATEAPAPAKAAPEVVLTGAVEEPTETTSPAPAAPVAAATPPAAEKPAEAPAPLAATASAAASPVAPAPGEVRLVNSKHISLNYEVKDVGTSGITDVELWCTRDGRTWKKLKAFHQAQPPCVADVDDEDLYGFTLVVHTGAGLGKAPQEGDRPQVWVEVDVTKPTVHLLGVEAGKGPGGRQLTITWKAADKNLAAQPITLAYAAQAEGPWMPIATGLENSGRYVWQMPKEAPHRLFVRVEAADQVGNVGIAQTPNALLDDLSQPTISILKVEGAGK